MNAWGPPGHQLFLVDEAELREKILELSPEIRRDTDRMADLIRELVNLERARLGFDNPRGSLELYPNKEKKAANDPDLIGTGVIAGRAYRVSAWISGSDKIRVSLLPRRKPRDRSMEGIP